MSQEVGYELVGSGCECQKTFTPTFTKEELQLLREVQLCKRELRKQPLKKTGRNKNKGYSYFELEDFIEYVECILETHGLNSVNTFHDDKGYLTIFNEDGVYHTWETKCIGAKAKENGYDTGIHMKTEQAVQTYARRALWLQALDITEPSALEAGDVVPSKRQNKPRPKPKKQSSPVQPIREEKESEITEQDVNDMMNRAEDNLVLAGAEITEENMRKALKKECRNKPQLHKACLQKLKFSKGGKK